MIKVGTSYKGKDILFSYIRKKLCRESASSPTKLFLSRILSMLCHAILYYITLCYPILHYVLYHTMLRHTMPCRTMLHHTMPCCTMLHHTMLCLCHTTLSLHFLALIPSVSSDTSAAPLRLLHLRTLLSLPSGFSHSNLPLLPPHRSSHLPHSRSIPLPGSDK